MGRPRSKNRMSRMVQARVTDEQYDYLAHQAIDLYEGDMSAAIRAALTWAKHFEEILEAPDPGEAVRALKETWEREWDKRRFTLRMDEPGEEADSNED